MDLLPNFCHQLRSATQSIILPASDTFRTLLVVTIPILTGFLLSLFASNRENIACQRPGDGRWWWQRGVDAVRGIARYRAEVGMAGEDFAHGESREI
jgi:hypothetical protein